MERDSIYTHVYIYIYIVIYIYIYVHIYSQATKPPPPPPPNCSFLLPGHSLTNNVDRFLLLKSQPASQPMMLGNTILPSAANHQQPCS